jgi:hypothetical protein
MYSAVPPGDSEEKRAECRTDPQDLDEAEGGSQPAQGRLLVMAMIEDGAAGNGPFPFTSTPGRWP